MSSATHKLETQSEVKSFFQYFIPTLLGMMLMSVNIVIDGIFVGYGVGAVARTDVNIAVRVLSVIISSALLIGIGGGTPYSLPMGRNEAENARKIFTLSMVLIIVVTA